MGKAALERVRVSRIKRRPETGWLEPAHLLTRLRTARDFPELLATRRMFAPEFDQQHLAAAWARSAKLAAVPQHKAWLDDNFDRLYPLREQTHDALRSDTLDDFHLSVAARAMATLGVGSEPPWSTFWLEACRRSAHALEVTSVLDLPANVAIAHSATASGHRAPLLLDALSAAAGARLDELDLCALSELVQTCALADLSRPRLLEAAAAAATERIRDEEAPAGEKPRGEHLAALATAYSTVYASVPAGGLFDAIADEVADRAYAFKPQHLAAIARSVSLAGVQHAPMYDAIAAHATPRLHRFKAFNLVSLALGFAANRHEAPALYGGVLQQVRIRPREFSRATVAKLEAALADFGALGDGRGPQQLGITASATTPLLHTGDEEVDGWHLREPSA
jgi:hypothetical protein